MITAANYPQFRADSGNDILMKIINIVTLLKEVRGLWIACVCVAGRAYFVRTIS